MDKVRFNKMMRDAQFVRECGALSSSTADRIFQRSLPAVENQASFNCAPIHADVAHTLEGLQFFVLVALSYGCVTIIV
eukprot:288099-Pelagomonas_calceolata.AAC.1